MFLNFAKFIRFSKYGRAYSYDARPIEMACNIFENKNTDNTKPPLMIMHGLFGSKQNWRAVSRSLESKTNRKIITLDARNHGQSPHTDEHSSMHMAVDVIELMKQMGIPKASVMGHSMGGRTMMFLALKYPEYVSDGIIVDISPISVPRDFFQMEQIFLAMKDIQIPAELSMGDGRKFAEVEIKKVVSQKETVDFILLNLRKIDGKFSWAVNVNALHNNLSQFTNFMDQISGLGPYKGKMMFVCGNKSNFVDPKSWPQIQKIFPNSEIHWLDAGHLVHFDQPSKFIELLVKFLNK
ncbi:sn-1-specific diacylglycerol lipase ABHD11 [Calliphora vicina]|uniref:sn-1-specific diacylglycerol lipase ABHD11 n=1 Tax=Calliphora vicina TaxID=7373 RepID=UPI00325B7BAB